MPSNIPLCYYNTLQGEIALTDDNQLMIKKGKTSFQYFPFDNGKSEQLDTLAHLMAKPWVEGEMMFCMLMIFERFSKYYEIKSICKSFINELNFAWFGGDDDAQ